MSNNTEQEQFGQKHMRFFLKKNKPHINTGSLIDFFIFDKAVFHWCADNTGDKTTRPITDSASSDDFHLL